MTRLMAGLGLTVLLLGAPLEAQGGPPTRGRPLRVDGQQELNFGQLLTGLPSAVLPNDPLNAARVQVSGEKDSDLLISFFLPAALIGPGGAGVPLIFGPADAGYSAERSVDTQVPFDPAAPSVIRLPGNGRGLLFLGGTALPAGTLPAGDYAATVTLTISYLGN
ncbi:MAG TPA: hypothetical protein VK858_12295 [Longimicrobiales bacterium]|nr:hypothetical protein [Longimicrobiales bacterium]